LGEGACASSWGEGLEELSGGRCGFHEGRTIVALKLDD
jgi:hypothetical protein